MGLTMGVVDTLKFMGAPFDIPAKTNASQLFAIIVKYINDHPQEWGKGAQVIKLNALYEVWPKQEQTEEN